MYQKFQATQIFTGTELLEDQLVLITQKDGTIEAMVGIEDAGDDVQNFEGILTPGFINAHCHLELSHLKETGEKGKGFLEFAGTIRKRDDFSAFEKQNAIEKAEQEMTPSGDQKSVNKSRHGNSKVTRDEWLQAARDILVTKGASDVKVLTLSKRLGVARSSFYWYFELWRVP